MAKPLFVAALLALPLAASAAAPDLDYHPVRSPAARTEFVKANPCPANDKTRRTCPGYVVGHIEPLCAGGTDHPSNMQWQTLAEAKMKDAEERRQCAATKTTPAN